MKHVLFCRQGAEVDTAPVQHPMDLRIPNHNACHNDLAPFSDLMKWLKEVDQAVFLELCQVGD